MATPTQLTYLVKNVLELVLGQSRTLDVLHRTKVLRHLLAIFPAYWLHLLLSELVTDGGVVAEIDLGSDDEARNARAMMVDFREPLLANVFEGRGGCDGETHKEDISLRVGQGTQTVVIFLTSSVEQSEGVGFVADPIKGSMLC